MDKFIPLSIPNFEGNERKYVDQAIEEGWVSTGGAFINQLEEKLAMFIHAPKVAACQSGTAALHLALIECGVVPGDMVIVPTVTFIAAVNPVRYQFAEPVFMDCDDSLCMDPRKLRRFCELECELCGDKLLHKATGRQVKAVIVVHVFGNMADMEAIMQVAEDYHIRVVEDATEAIGTYYTRGRYEGCYAGTIGDIGVYSFNGNKIMTTGGGGMIVSKDESFLERAKHLTTQAKADSLYYVHDEIGYNYRMTNLQAALGLAQLEQLESFIQIKSDNYQEYQQCVEKLEGLSLLPVREGIRSNHWFYAFLCDGQRLNRDTLMERLSAKKIQSRPIWGLIHEQVPYEGARAYGIERAKFYWDHVINLPCSTSLTTNDVHVVMDAVTEIAGET